MYVTIPGLPRALTLLALGAMVSTLAACAPTIYHNANGMTVMGGGGRDSATEYHGKPIPIQVGVVEAALRNPAVWPIQRYFKTVLHMRKNPPDTSFITKVINDQALKSLDYMIKVLAAAGVPEEKVTPELLQKLYAKMMAPHIAKALLEQGWAQFNWGSGGPNKEGTQLGIGPGGGGYFTPYPDQQEVAIHVATEISSSAWKHFTYDVSKIDKCFTAPTDAVTRDQADKLLVLQDTGEGGGDSDK